MSGLVQQTATKAVERNSNPTIRDWITSNRASIERHLAGAMDTTAFVQQALTSINNSADLQAATPSSVIGAVMLAAQLRLEIGPALGQFYLTPRKDHGKQICLPIVGYQGMVELAYRSGRVEKVESFLVRDGDTFSHGANSERGRFFDWTPLDYDEDRPWTGVVATAKIQGGGTVWTYLPKAKVLARRPSFWASTPWKTAEEQMARKTGVRALSPYMPKSTDLGRALQTDGAKVESLTGMSDLVVTRVGEEDTTAPPGTAPAAGDDDAYTPPADPEHDAWVAEQERAQGGAA